MREYNVAYGMVTWTGFPDANETWDSLPKNSRRVVIENQINDWPLSKCWNWLVQKLCVDEGFEAVVICNDDIALRPDTGQLLADALITRQFEDDRPFREKKIELVSAYNVRDLPDIGVRWGTGPDYSCFCVTREIFDTQGKFDEKIHIYHEDGDSHHRIKCAGFEALSYAPYYHHGSQTVRRDPSRAEAVRQYYEASQAYFLAKWGGLPGRERYVVPFNGNRVGVGV